MFHPKVYVNAASSYNLIKLDSLLEHVTAINHQTFGDGRAIYILIDSIKHEMPVTISHKLYKTLQTQQINGDQVAAMENLNYLYSE